MHTGRTGAKRRSSRERSDQSYRERSDQSYSERQRAVVLRGTPVPRIGVIRAALISSLVIAAAACRVDSRDDYLGDKDPRRFGLGQPATPNQIAMENIDVSPNGAGLPAGRGTPEQGAAVYARACASCHGANGEGKPPLYPQILGGSRATFDFADNPKIPRTIGNYWPYATTLYDYIRRSMPLTAPGSLSADETYAVVAYLLNREGLVPPGATLDARTLPAVAMPARPHFVLDDRAGSVGGAKVK